MKMTLTVANLVRIAMTNSVNAERFGGDYPKLQSARDGIDRYLIAGTCMGLDIETGEVYAPNGRPTLSTDCLESIQKTPDQTCSTRRRTVIRFAGLGSGS